MTLPEQPVTLTVEQIAALNRQLSDMRHKINNHASLVIAAVELIRTKPAMSERMFTTLLEQPAKISHALQEFSGQFQQTFGIQRD